MKHEYNNVDTVLKYLLKTRPDSYSDTKLGSYAEIKNFNVHMQEYQDSTDTDREDYFEQFGDYDLRVIVYKHPNYGKPFIAILYDTYTDKNKFYILAKACFFEDEDMTVDKVEEFKKAIFNFREKVKSDKKP